jgi:hypothetical protein
MAIIVRHVCDGCDKDISDLGIRTNMPRGNTIESPMPAGNVWWIRMREGDGGHREIHWHFCGEQCLAKWAADQARARTKAPPPSSEDPKR